jgi:hypothetical protein
LESDVRLSRASRSFDRDAALPVPALCGHRCDLPIGSHPTAERMCLPHSPLCLFDTKKNLQKYSSISIPFSVYVVLPYPSLVLCLNSARTRTGAAAADPSGETSRRAPTPLALRPSHHGSRRSTVHLTVRLVERPPGRARMHLYSSGAGPFPATVSMIR